jgi:hypothetical protein
MRYVFASLTAAVVCLAAVQLVTATDLSHSKVERAAIDIQALTKASGNLPTTVADAI